MVTQDGYYRRLRESIDQSDRRLNPWRADRVNLIKKYAGKRFTHDDAQQSDPANLMYQTANVYMMSMAANRPQVLVTAEDPRLIGFRSTFQTNLNNLLEQLKVHVTFQQCVLDAFFCFGVAKTTLGDHGSVEIETNKFVDPGRPYIGRVSFDDFGFDTSSHDWSKIRYAWDCYQVPMRKLVEDPVMYDQELVRNLQPSTVPQRSQIGEERVAEIQTEGDPDSVDLEPMVTLMDVWLPERQQVWICAKDHSSLPPLAVVDWYGRESGPYQILRLGMVPDMILTATPAMQLAHLHDVVNRLIRKGEKEAKNRKQVGIGTPAAAADAATIVKASHGDFVTVKNIADIGEISFNGVDGPTQAFAIGLEDLFDRMAGNLQAMGGLGPQSGTATQDQLIHDRVSKNEAFMLTSVLEFMSDVVLDAAHLMWNDAALQIEGTLTIPGTDWTVPNNWTPDHRVGRFDQYGFRIDPYSLPYRSPLQRLEALNSALQLYLEMQSAGVLAQYGAQIDVQKLVEIQAELLGEPRLKEVVRFDAPAQDPDPRSQGDGGMPRDTVRKYVRENVPTGGTEKSRHGTLQQTLLSGNSNANDDQMAALMR